MKPMLDKHHYQSLMAVEGQCKIDSIHPLQLKYLKTIIVILVSILTVIPAIILLNFKKIRRIFIYSDCQFQQATHLYVNTKNDGDDIVELKNQDGHRLFSFNQLKYQLIGNIHTPFVLDYSKYISKISNQKHNLKTGLMQEEVLQNKKLYGENNHEVNIQNYFSYMFGVIFQPIFILQYIVVLSLSIQGLPLFGILLIVGSFITTSINYIALYFSKKKIKEAAIKNIKVTIVRQNQMYQVQCSKIVPGDIFIIKQPCQISCDAILLEGSIFVNQSSLTGQDIPIKKNPIQGQKYSSQNWLYDGTKVIETSKNSIAIVIYSGFSSKKGRMLRKILYRIPSSPDMFIKIIIFLLQSCIIALIMYFSTLPIRLGVDINRFIISLRLIDYIVAAVPPAVPIYFTIAYSWSLYRLKKNNIICTIPQKTVQANRLSFICFDKTGTLTSNNLKINNIMLVNKNRNQVKQIQIQNQIQNQLEIANNIFGCCHSVRNIDGILKGDQIDLKMLELSKFQFSNQDKSILLNKKGDKYQILRINQFQSKFQSMSVLVKQLKTQKYYIFAKGAPQKLYTYSNNKYPYFIQTVNKMSLKGLRTIAFGYSCIDKQQCVNLLSKNRQQYLNNLQVIGLICFNNQLKIDTKQTIKILKDYKISTCMITGDNLHVATQIGYQSQILQQNIPICLIQGKKYIIQNNIKIYDILQIRNINKNRQISNKMYTFHQMCQLNCVFAVDNDYISDQCSNQNKNKDKNEDKQYKMILSRIKIFARILPENKAKIIKILKQQQQQQYHNKPMINKIFGQGRSKIGMVGDGANDLMAIKQSDMGVGISVSDAVIGSSFSVDNLYKIVDIIKQGKCTTINIIQFLRFTLVSNYIVLTTQVLLATQATFVSNAQGIYISFFIILFLPLMSLSGPPRSSSSPSSPSSSPSLSPQTSHPNANSNKVIDNYLHWSNQLSTWGTILILISGQISIYFYLTRSNGYVPNPIQKWDIIVGYNYNCQLVTVIYLVQCILICSIGWIVYQSIPFKQYIYNNILLSLALLINFIIFTIYCIVIGIGEYKLQFLDLIPIQSIKMGIIYLILIIAIVCAAIFNYSIHKLTNNNKRYVKIQNEDSNITLTEMNSYQIGYNNRKFGIMNQQLLQ